MIEITYVGPNRWENVGTTFGMTLQDVIDYGYDLHMSDYPIWDESMREWLNGMIVNHFRFREIRAETPLLFCMWLERLLGENMPYINPVFAALQDATLETLRDSHYLSRHEEGSRHEDGTRDDTMTDSSEGGSTSTGRTEDERGTSTVTSDEAHSTSSGSGHNYASTNPKQTMVGKDATNYYDSGTYTDTSSNGSNSDERSETVNTDGLLTTSMSEEYESTDENVTHGTDSRDGTDTRDVIERGYDGASLTTWLREWREIAANPLKMVFDALEPAFCQLHTSHFNCF